MGAAVKDVREVLEEVDPMQSAGTGQGVEDGTALRPGMAAEEQGVLPGEGDIAVDALNEVIVPGVVATRGDGFNAIPLVQEVVHGSAHLRFGVHFDNSKTARKITPADYARFDRIICMDASNLRLIRRIIPSDPDSKIHLLMSYTGRSRDVADPWYTGDFETTF